MIAISAGSRSNASTPPASISAATPNGLTQLRSVTIRSGSPRPRISRPSTSASTMSPRWTLSSIPLRTWRTRIGGTVRAFAERRPAVAVAPSAPVADERRVEGRRWAGRSGAVTIGRGYCDRGSVVVPCRSDRAVGRAGRATTPWAPGRAIRPGTPDRDATLAASDRPVNGRRPPVGGEPRAARLTRASPVTADGYCLGPAVNRPGLGRHL